MGNSDSNVYYLPQVVRIGYETRIKSGVTYLTPAPIYENVPHKFFNGHLVQITEKQARRMRKYQQY